MNGLVIQQKLIRKTGMKLIEYLLETAELENSGRKLEESSAQLLLEAKKSRKRAARKLANFKELWKKYKENPELAERLRNKKTGKFVGRPGTGERFINCVLYQAARGYSFNSALAICQDICNKRYGKHGCVRIAQMVRRAYEGE
jgi:hypothetical protein